MGQLEGGRLGLLPEEAGAAWLYSPIKLPVLRDWDLGDTAHATPQSLHIGLWAAYGHAETKGSVTMELY